MNGGTGSWLRLGEKRFRQALRHRKELPYRPAQISGKALRDNKVPNSNVSGTLRVRFRPAAHGNQLWALLGPYLAAGWNMLEYKELYLPISEGV